jgi:hypothetical protein
LRDIVPSLSVWDSESNCEARAELFFRLRSLLCICAQEIYTEATEERRSAAVPQSVSMEETGRFPLVSSVVSEAPAVKKIW